ncbi:MAG: nucleotide sugar dehydrogenase [Egibacteraceae bacterium]
MARQSDVVVVGLGYVGLPLVVEAVRAGLTVVGLDQDQERVRSLNNGRSHIDDLSDDDVAALVADGFSATADPRAVADTRAVALCVPTPLDRSGAPDLSAVRAAAVSVSSYLTPGALVVLESTTYPGTTEEVIRPLLENGSGLVAGRDFHLAYSPERIDPGNKRFTLRTIPKVVAGLTPACAEAAAVFYGKVCDQLVRAKGIREAEMAKLLENTYRHVNIALVNEMAVFCAELGIDLWDAIEVASTKPFGFQAFHPGPGVGGHCIPIDPNYLSYKVRTLGYPFRFVELAQEINNRMPAYVADRVQRLLNRHHQPVNGSKILMLGVTYKPDISDQRESPARSLAKRLLALGADLSYHDPYVPSWKVDELRLECVPDPVAAARDADLVLLVQPHTVYDLDAIAASAPLLFDTCGKLTGQRVERL